MGGLSLAFQECTHCFSVSKFKSSELYSIENVHDNGWWWRWSSMPGCSFGGQSRGKIRNNIRPIKAFSVGTPPFPLFNPPKVEEESPSELEPVDPDFYKIGYARSMRAYGVEFKEGPDGFGVFASKDVEPLRRARMIMEIPIELMLTISKKLPWMFFPDIIPIGHPIFDIINSTNPETDWDLRLACLLLYAFDCKDNFWQLYGDFLPSADECTSLLLSTEEDLLELQDPDLASTMREQQHRALEFWEKNWHSGAPLKIKRLARDPERFIWAVTMAQSRCINMQMRIGALIQDANMLVPYADMLNHSFEPNCFFHWRFKDRMLEVMINAGQHIKKGEEMTINYMNGQRNNTIMQRYGFSSPVNPWDVIPFSGNARIHLDSFLSVFNISGLPEEYYHNSQLSDKRDTFVDGAVIAAARTLPTWSDGDMPPVPSTERRAVRELQEECHQMLAKFPTTSKEDEKLLGKLPFPVFSNVLDGTAQQEQQHRDRRLMEPQHLYPFSSPSSTSCRFYDRSQKDPRGCNRVQIASEVVDSEGDPDIGNLSRADIVLSIELVGVSLDDPLTILLCIPCAEREGIQSSAL